MQIDFSNEMPILFKAADYAISRAGANTNIELLANMIPTIFIPLPKGTSRGDQIENAKYITSKGAAKMILQNELNIKKLQNELKKLQKDADLILKSIKKLKIEDGTKNIVDIILQQKNT